jgi:hypothetical protein
MKFEFDTEIKGMPTMETAFIEFPFVVKETFGATRQLKVRANFDGYEYRSSLTKMGHYCHFLIIRKTIGKHPGETVHVIIEKDTEPHLVEVPTDFLEAMAAESKIKFFLTTCHTLIKMNMFTELQQQKKTATRNCRIQKTLEILRNKQKYS